MTLNEWEQRNSWATANGSGTPGTSDPQQRDQEFLTLNKRIRNSWPSIKRSGIPDTQQRDQKLLTLNKGIRNFWHSTKRWEIPDPQQRDQEFLTLNKTIRNSWPSIKRSGIPDPQQKDQEFLTLNKTIRNFWHLTKGWGIPDPQQMTRAIQNKGMQNSCVDMDDSIKMKSCITSQGGYSYRYLTTKFIKQDFKTSIVIFPNLSILVNSNPYSIIEHFSTLSVHSTNVLLTWCLAILQGLL